MSGSAPHTHDCSGEVAAYVLGALEPAEARAFERHLEACVVCRDEAAAFNEVTDVLPLTVPQYPVPPSLRRSVRRAVRSDARSRRAQRAGRTAPARLWQLFPRPVLAGGGALAAVAAVVLVLVLAVGGSGRHARVVTASVVGSGQAEVRVTDGHAELVLHRFEAPPAGEVYEVWLQRGHGAPQPTKTLFSVTADGGADVGVDGSLKGVSRVLVTPEHAGGSPVPTHPPVIVARLA